jgi:uncharacterized membrane protein YhaH (DUF805 family)
MAHAEGDAVARAVPAYVYLGPLLLVLVMVSVVSGSLSIAFSFSVSALRDTGMSIGQISAWSGVVNTLVWVITTVLALLLMYWGAKGGLRWFAFLMNPGGRATRAEYWLRYWLPFLALTLIVLVAVGLGALIVALVAGDYWEEVTLGYLSASYIFLIRADVLLFWPWFAVMAKRLHDRGKSAWFLLILLIPILGPLWLFVEVAFLPGQKGDNRYGPDPLAAA